MKILLSTLLFLAAFASTVAFADAASPNSADPNLAKAGTPSEGGTAGPGNQDPNCKICSTNLFPGALNSTTKHEGLSEISGDTTKVGDKENNGTK